MFFDLPPVEYKEPLTAEVRTQKNADEPYEPSTFEVYFPGIRDITVDFIQKIVIGRTLDLEGGSKYTNYMENGKRRPTKWGVTLDTLRRINPKATANDVKRLTKDEAIAIYKTFYWDEGQVSKAPLYLQDLIFDGMVNHGTYGMTKVIQRALNDIGHKLKVDGIMGNATLNALNEKDLQETRVAILDRRKSLYKGLRDYHKFGRGWMNRLAAVSKPPTDLLTYMEA